MYAYFYVLYIIFSFSIQFICWLVWIYLEQYGIYAIYRAIFLAIEPWQKPWNDTLTKANCVRVLFHSLHTCIQANTHIHIQSIYAKCGTKEKVNNRVGGMVHGWRKRWRGKDDLIGCSSSYVVCVVTFSHLAGSFQPKFLCSFVGKAFISN